ncbi:MAG: hypothetical protein A2X56_08970 [Nitrospirae bacterium GWC2_57_13]|jgi:uncharacterized protein|nr:MAG: hypothetical protein A2072_05015 [Nitrospirae bacterium GWC1_57_7]OGW27964.1 MAG: hypothetical protein A2X56_08970 [Nitrospirae bacterium GWC2_57_13]HAS55308.1 hypothetical protein [Nitrospiraceae bacterium]
MRLSEDRISHLSRLIMTGIVDGGFVEPAQPPEKVYREIKRSVVAELETEVEVDAVVRRKIQSLSRKVPEGSAEWTVLYRKFMDEEMGRRKRL